MPGIAGTAALTTLALVAFASNSILTRLALRQGEMDAATFTTVRLTAGALVLVALVRIRSGGWRALRGKGFAGPVALFAYAVPFSFAYVRIGAAAGALLLFSAVQFTMIGWGVTHGERPRARVWLGLALALAGLLWLTLPAMGRPDPLGTALMLVAGVAWGLYSIAGKTAPDAVAANARSFIWAMPMAALVNLLSLSSASASARGIFLAMVAGGITSGLGYAIWYRALRGLAAAQAAILQLAVPVVAALGAVAILHEQPSPRLAAASVAVLGGLALALVGQGRRG